MDAVAELICTVNGALVAPAATVTLVGAETAAAVAVHPICTVVPPDGAGPESVTVHCDDAGAVTEVGLHEKALSETDVVLLMLTVAPEPVEATAAPAPDVATVFAT